MSVRSIIPRLIVTPASPSAQKVNIAPVVRAVVTHSHCLAKRDFSAQEQEHSSSVRLVTTKMQLDSPLASSVVPHLRLRDTIAMAAIQVEKEFFVRLDAIAHLVPSTLTIILARKASTILVQAHVIYQLVYHVQRDTTANS